MFEGAVHAWHLRKLHEEKKRVQASYKALVKEAKASKKSELELDRLWFEERMKVQIVDAEIYDLITQRLILLADRHSIPHPKFMSEGGSWIQTGAASRWHLTIEAMAELRAAIRQEKRDRLIYSLMWLSAATGLLGTSIGLISLLLKK
jgi:hypothetical protein